MNEDQATILALRRALAQTIYDTEGGSASDACQKVIETAEEALAPTPSEWLRKAQDDRAELETLRKAFGSLHVILAPSRDGSHPRNTIAAALDVVMSSSAQITMQVDSSGKPWRDLHSEIDELKAEISSHERYRQLVRDNVAEQVWVKENKNMKELVSQAAEALFNGSKAIQIFQPGSEAAKLQAGVDEAHKFLHAALEGKRITPYINWTLVSGIYSALSCLETNHKWDLSVGENACLAGVFYSHLIKRFPNSKNELTQWFEEAAIATWGVDHQCDTISDEEMKTFLYSLDDTYFDRNGRSASNYSDYLSFLGLGSKFEQPDDGSAEP